MLTDTRLKSLKKTPIPGKHVDGTGLFLKITDKGGMYWQWRIRTPKETLVSYGTYPEVTLADARKKHREAQDLRRNGMEPNQAKKEAQKAKAVATENNFETIACEWHEMKKTGWSVSHADTTMERMQLNLFAWVGSTPITKIDAPLLLTTLRRIENRGAIDTTHRVKSILTNVFRYAIATGRASINPAADLGAALKTTVKGHHPAIVEPARFGQMLRDVYTYSGSYITRAALQIHALTCQRPNEVSSMAWAEIDLDAALWTIPPARMKNVLERKVHGAAHLIPLSLQAVAVLRDIKPLTGSGLLVFPSERGQGRCISENTCRMALRSMGYVDHVPHGFRASIRTMAREHLHFNKEVIERQLSHGSDEELGGAYGPHPISC